MHTEVTCICTQIKAAYACCDQDKFSTVAGLTLFDNLWPVSEETCSLSALENT